MNRAQLMTSAAVLRSPDEPSSQANQDAPLPTSLDALGKLGATSSTGAIGLDTTNPPDVAPVEEAPAEAAKPEGVSDEDWALLQDAKAKHNKDPDEVPKEEVTEEETPADARTDDEIRASLKEAGGFYADPKYEPFAIEFERKGELSPESLTKAAEAFGVPEDMVKTFVDGQKAIREKATVSASTAETEMVTALTETVGGKEAFDALKEWSVANKADPALAPLLEEYNNATSQGHAKRVLSDIQALYREAGNGSPRDITEESRQGPTSKGGAAPYASDAEMHRDQADPRYQSDPAFRDQVMARARATK